MKGLACTLTNSDNHWHMCLDTKYFFVKRLRFLLKYVDIEAFVPSPFIYNNTDCKYEGC